MSHRFPRANRIRYIKEATGWTSLANKRILDWGGNAGNLLRDGLELGEIKASDYVCVDVDNEVMVQCAHEIPQATWITRQHQNPMYSPEIKQSIYPELPDHAFDLVFAYSVYSHESHRVLMSDLDFLRRHLAIGGTLLFTVVTAKTIAWFLEKRSCDYGWALPKEVFDNIDDVMYYINNNIVHRDFDKISDCDFLVTVYNEHWLREQISIFSNASVFNPSRNQYQQGIIMHK